KPCGSAGIARLGSGAVKDHYRWMLAALVRQVQRAGEQRIAARESDLFLAGARFPAAAAFAGKKRQSENCPDFHVPSWAIELPACDADRTAQESMFLPTSGIGCAGLNSLAPARANEKIRLR